ncbi:leucine-rich repeat domain-containing protein [Neochlamydia sp. TUME1]|uniref:leucine-rich repeat domain-containing protein n=1 Tax=Neochlamydia sp. TUME1 TaxID=1478174 RepID=UPI00068F6135|nr:leucine-rich repeat domain-containing protein [Neochlamydia sp. TUME1]
MTPLEEIKHKPSEEAVGHFLRGKELAEKGEHAIAIEALLQALQLSPTYEKAKAYLEFCLRKFSESRFPSQSLPSFFLPLEKGKEKSLSSTDSPKERYTELLFDVLEESSIQENLILKKILENQVEELMNQENEELTEKEKVSYKWTEKLLAENKEVRQFVVEKLKQIYQNPYPPPTVAPHPSIFTASSSSASVKEIQSLSLSSVTPISMGSLYTAIVQVHFSDKNEGVIGQACIVDKIYEIESNLSVEEKVSYIFQKLFTLATSLSPLEFEENPKESKAFTLSNYSSYLLNINRLLIWQKLPGGTEYLNQPHIKALSLKKKGELLTHWIEAQGENITSLNLSNSGLTFLPLEIGQLSQLQKLYLDNNQLTALPDEIGQLSRLEVLVLSDNQLTAVTVELCQLLRLTWLNLRDNQLTALPDEIGQLSRLEVLELSDNQLAALPAAIGQLSQLQWLYLNDNLLTNLPDVIGQLSQLEKIHLSHNQLMAIPTAIGQLSQLKVLNVDSNQLTAIPAALGQLAQLQMLGLSDNQLTAIPSEVGQLARLQMLWLGDNQLAFLLSAIGQLSWLQYLYLEYNQLAALPAEIGQLAGLQVLDLSHNQLTTLPPEIEQLPVLQMLDLRHNQLTALPAALGQIYQLQQLSFSSDQVITPPPQVPELRTLKLEGNAALKNILM